MARTSAFTIVELMVVVTIIAILLALLVPTLDQAIYQAQLAVCGAKQHAVASSTVIYAMDHKRHYPYRHAARDHTTGWQPRQLYNGNPIIRAIIRGDNDAVHDDRTILRTYLTLNHHLIDPLAGTIDFEDIEEDASAYLPFNLWFGFRWMLHRGMFRLGDRWTFTDRGIERRFSVLLSDAEETAVGTGNALGSHPDKWQLMYNLRLQNGLWDFGFGPDAGLKMTNAFWESRRVRRGPVDGNYAYDDGSVRRVVDMEFQDREMAWGPNWNNTESPGQKVLLPKE